jgi:chemotaxis protein methyltransferase CheR
MAIPDAEYTFLADLIRDRSGLVLTPEKAYLLESRLMPVARKHGHESLGAMVTSARAKPVEALFSDITEAMMTNESFFFRDTKPFDLLRESVLLALLEKRKDQKNIRIWCAAASTGQEPYSIAMILKEEATLRAGRSTC